MIYAGFDYYTNTYMGNAIAEADYPRMATRAGQYLDYITQGRSTQNAELEAVKMCACALAEKYQSIDAAEMLARSTLSAKLEDGRELQSETNGTWSQSYRSGGDSAQSAAQAAKEGRSLLLDTVRMYLANTGLLYRGRRCCL